MELWEYPGKMVRLVTKSGNIFEGKCEGYTQALDNDPEIESIDIVTEPGAGYGYEIYKNEIKSIEVTE